MCNQHPHEPREESPLAHGSDSRLSRLTRRELLALLGAGTLGAALTGWPGDLSAAGLAGGARAGERGLGDAAAWPEPFAPARLEPFALDRVRLLDGPFLDAQRRDAAYLLSLEPDRMLHNFRVNAGLQPKAPVYGGWESEEPWVDIRCHGHTLGHYLAAVSFMYAATGDARMKERADYIVAELKACQDAAGTGLVCAFPDGAAQLENAVTGNRFVGVPWYTMHKVFAGLRDAHVHAGSGDALAVLVKLSDWAVTRTAGMSDEQFQRMLRTEHGGMNEVLADVSALTGDARYLALARRFSHQALLEPLAAERDTLDGLHSNTQIPKVVGFQRLHELTGEDSYGRAARFFWHTVVERRSFVTGGHGDFEHFFPPAEFAKHLGSAKTMETCCTHNMLRLTRMLLLQEPAAPYADYYERALYNGILASQDPESGMMTYFQATRPGYVRLFHTPTKSFWCCTGTGMENHARYGDTIYAHGPDALYVNLFIPSVVDWKEKGLTIRQTTRFPEASVSRLAIAAARPVRAALHVRRPGWSPGMAVTVNGRRWRAAPSASGYLAIERLWRGGDVVEVTLPMQLRAETLPGVPDTVAFLYGPIVLAGRLGTEGLTPGSQIIVNERESGNMLNASLEIPALVGDVPAVLRRMRKDPQAPLAFRTVGAGRPAEVSLAPWFRLAHERYNLYWKLLPG